MTRRRSFVVGLSALLLAIPAAGCGVEPARPPTVSLRLAGKPGDASVTIDDRPIGALAFVAKHGVALPPGRHRITVEKNGYFPWDHLVEAQEAPIRLDVVLEPIPD